MEWLVLGQSGGESTPRPPSRPRGASATRVPSSRGPAAPFAPGRPASRPLGERRVSVVFGEVSRKTHRIAILFPLSVPRRFTAHECVRWQRTAHEPGVRRDEFAPLGLGEGGFPWLARALDWMHSASQTRTVWSPEPETS